MLRRAVEDRRETVDELHRVIGEVLSDVGEGPPTPDQLRELIRRTTNANIESVAASRSWQMVMALRAILHSAPEDTQDRELADWMNESEEQLRIEAIETIYKPMAEYFGFRPKAMYGDRAWHYIEIIASSMSEGLALRYPLRAGDYVKDLPHPDHPDAGANWSLFSLMFERVVFTFLERVDGTEW